MQLIYTKIKLKKLFRTQNELNCTTIFTLKKSDYITYIITLHNLSINHFQKDKKNVHMRIKKGLFSTALVPL